MHNTDMAVAISVKWNRQEYDLCTKTLLVGVALQKALNMDLCMPTHT